MASTLMFWNKQNSNSSQNGSNDAKNTKNGRNWLHAPDVLVNGHVAYLVKYLGSTPVEQPKGIEVVKEAIRRLQFTQQMKKAEGGGNVKTKKVEITVSVDGVAIQEPRSQVIMHQFPLHKISYCADEKGVKKFFSFIAKTGTSNTPSTVSSLSSGAGDDSSINNSNGSTNGNGEDRHECFVFISNKLASDITLTIGQAFELAYRRYVSDSGKSLESTKLLTQKKQLENTVTAYRQRLKELSELVSKSDLDKLLVRHGLRDICDAPPAERDENGTGDGHNGYNGTNINNNNNHNHNGNKTPDLGIDVTLPNNDDQLLIETSPKHFVPLVPPRNIQNQINSTLEAFKPSVGTKLEGLLLNSDSDSDFDPRAPDNDGSSTTTSSGGGNKISNDLFGFEPPAKPMSATLGQQLFGSSNGHSTAINGNHGFTNGGSNGTTLTNGFGAPTSPPPILAPPPAKSAPRRTAAPLTNGGGNTNGTSAYQDLFGSAPFNPQSSSDDSAFLEESFAPISANDATYTIDRANSSALGSHAFSDEVRILANNAHKLDSILAYGGAGGGGTVVASTEGCGDANTANVPHVATTMPTGVASKLNPFVSSVIASAPAISAVLRTNPLSAVQHKAAAYDVFKNPGDMERLTNNHHNNNNGTAQEMATTVGGHDAAGGLCANGSSVINNTSITSGSASHEQPASEAMFEDFAISAFNEFKKSSTANTRPIPCVRQSIAKPPIIKPSSPLSSSSFITNNAGAGMVHAMGATGGEGTAATVGAYRCFGATVLLQPEMKTSKNGFFSSDDVLDTFDPLKK
ncbi:PTB domain-containing adapter protein ced-6 isoform X1 [Anopheles aquasalis]|uniref:PTB domain-containing adapter protein ced-6 isoform X1 n=1 Tax=Anopheles aquasalis TaxID=42839 RepID=UPI00215B001A|nr:PTB domain-containing adapter protein ced-6 isoform X1 [Anopheles aquasalis]